MFFSNAKRNDIKAANPNASFGDIVRMIMPFTIISQSSFLHVLCSLNLIFRASSLDQHGKSSEEMKRPSGKKKQKKIRCAIKRK